MCRISFICLVVVAALLLPVSAHADTLSVTLTDPANGGLITGGQPTFTGSVGTATGTVIVSVYSGSTIPTLGLPAQTETATVSNGSYSVAATGLADGTYTAQASASDGSGDAGKSSPATFQIFNGTPELTLSAPAAPIFSATPTRTGTAQTASGDATSVTVTFYAGSSTDAVPAGSTTAAVGSGGSFSAQPSSGLANGTYTAVASQTLSDGSTTFSPAVGFSIINPPPALSITSPTAGASEAQTGIAFSGAAGTASGDEGEVNLSLYSGAAASGAPVGTATVTTSGGQWSDAWSSSLPQGTYTLAASQANADGQSTQVTRSFQVEAPGTLSPAVTISKRGVVTTRVSCPVSTGTCHGAVLVLTTARFATAYGGPRGPLALLFSHYSVVAGAASTLTSRLGAAQLRALRRAKPGKLKVNLVYPVGTTLTETSISTAKIKVG